MASAPDIVLSAEQRARYPTLAVYEDQPPHAIPDDGFDAGFEALLDGLRLARRGSTTTKEWT